MKALITGASSGIGKEMAIYLSKQDIEVVLVAKDRNKLLEVQKCDAFAHHPDKLDKRIDYLKETHKKLVKKNEI